MVFYASMHAALARATAAMLRDRLCGPPRAAARAPAAETHDTTTTAAADDHDHATNHDPAADYSSDSTDPRQSEPAEMRTTVLADPGSASEGELDT